MAEVWAWPETELLVQLLSLLSGEAQLMVQQLPKTSMMEYQNNIASTYGRWSSTRPAEDGCCRNSATPREWSTLWHAHLQEVMAKWVQCHRATLRQMCRTGGWEPCCCSWWGRHNLSLREMSERETWERRPERKSVLHTSMQRVEKNN